MKISVIAPVLNEYPWIGYSIMSCLEQMHEFIYSLDEKSDDGTRELLYHIKEKYAFDKLKIIDTPNFHPSDTKAYNAAFNACIADATGDAVFFFHPDMLITNPEAIPAIKEGPLAWYTNVTSYAGDFQTRIAKGRASKWKNIHARKFGVTYMGAYGSQNEDFYHTEITGKSLKHYGEEFTKYPFLVTNSKIEINHYCELKNYKRRFEKMKLCLRTQYPAVPEAVIEEEASRHPRVTLDPKYIKFGEFKFEKEDKPLPAVIEKYKAEFEAFKRSPVCA